MQERYHPKICLKSLRAILEETLNELLTHDNQGNMQEILQKYHLLPQQKTKIFLPSHNIKITNKMLQELSSKKDLSNLAAALLELRSYFLKKK